MHRPPSHQPLLPFIEVNDLWPTMPTEAQDRCQMLLVRLLLHTVRAADNERKSDEHREDLVEPS